MSRGARAEAARRANVHRSTITRWCAKGDDKCVREVEVDRRCEAIKKELTKEVATKETTNE